jgi:hypothetical protein
MERRVRGLLKAIPNPSRKKEKVNRYKRRGKKQVFVLFCGKVVGRMFLRVVVI